MRASVRSRWRGAVLLVVGAAGVVHGRASAQDMAEAMPNFDLVHGGIFEDEFGYKAWTTEDGLPQVSITALAQSSDGYIWIGTHGGLCRFDGVRFTVFDTANTPTLSGNRIVSLLGASNGDLWIGTLRSGVVRLRDGIFTSFKGQPYAPSGETRAIVEDGDGAIWFGGDTLTRYAKGSFYQFGPDDGMIECGKVWSLHLDHDDNLWVATDSGLGRLPEGDWQVFTDADGSSAPDVRFVGEDSQGGLWASGIDWYASLVDHRLVAASAPQPSIGWVFANTTDEFGNHIIGTDRGLFIDRHTPGGDGGLIELEFEEVVIPGLDSRNDFRSLLKDREGQVWVGIVRFGLLRMRDRHFAAFPLPAHTGRPRWPVSLSGDAKGDFWLVHHDTIAHLSGDQWTTPILPSPITNVEALASGRDGALWIAHDDNGLSEFKNDQYTHYIHPLGPILGILQGDDDILWLFSRKGLSSFRDGRFETVVARDHLPPLPQPVALHESPNGTLWIGALGTIVGYRDGEVIHSSTIDGLPGTEIRSIHESRDGSLWIATYGSGLIRLKSGSLTRIASQDGLSDNFLGKIVEDDEEHLWINSNRGVIRMSLEELNAVADGRISMIHPQLLRTGEGNGWGGARLSDGRLWFSTVDHLVVIDPHQFEINDIPPLVAIEGAVVGGAVMDPRTPVRIPPGGERLEITYTGLSFKEPDDVQFRYQLEGYDDEWVDAGSRRTAYYDQIPAGEYRFRMMACNDCGVWGEATAALPVTISPRLYERAWFMPLCGVVVFAAGLGGFLVRRRLVHRRYEILQKEVDRSNQAESSTRRSQKRLQDILDSLFGFVGVYSLDGVLTDANKAPLEAAGMTRDDVIGKPFWDTYWWSYDPEIQEQLRDALKRAAAGETVRYDVPVRVANDELIDIDITFGPLYDDEGRIVELIGFAVNITQRKRAEEALRESESRLAAFFSESPAGLVLFDSELRYVQINEQLARINGMSVQEHIGKTPQEVLGDFAIPNENRMRRVLETGEPELNIEIEGEMDHRPGYVSHFTASLFPIRVEDGEPIGVGWIIVDITERKLAEQALQESEARFRAIVESEPECVKLVSKDGQLLEMNTAGLAMLEAGSIEELRGHPMTNIIAPAHREAFADLHQRVMGGESATLEFEIIGCKGTRRWLDTHAVPLRDAEGAVTAHLAVTRDITAQRKAEEEIRQLAAAVGSTGDAIVISDCDGIIQYVNPAFTRMSGFSAVDVVGRSPRVYKSGLHNSAFYKRMWSKILNGEVWTGEVTNRRKDGSIYDTRLTIAPVRDDSGSVQGFVAVQHDITARKKAQEAIRIESERNRRILSGALDGFILLNIDGGLKDVNDALCAILGYTRNELLAMNIRDLEARETPEAITRHAEELIKTGYDRFETIHRHKDGNLIEVEVSATYLEADGKGQICSFVRDISQRKRAEQTLQRNKEALDELQGKLNLSIRSSSLTELTALFAHELNQPLAAVTNYVAASRELLRSETPRPERVLDILDRAGKSSLYAGGIIKRLAGFIRSGDTARSMVSLNDLIRQVIELFEVEARRLGVTIHLELAEGVPLIHGDSIQIQQLILNLVRNAMEAMGESSPDSPLIVRTCMPHADAIEVSIIDSGSGIATDEFDRIFDQFFTTKPDGLGVGLPICRRIVEQHGGIITATPNADRRGTTIRFTMSVVQQTKLDHPDSPATI